jgi:hypothetical protein
MIEELVNQQFEQLLIYFQRLKFKDDPFNSHKSDLDLMGNEVKLAIQNEILETELIKIQWLIYHLVQLKIVFVEH